MAEARDPGSLPELPRKMRQPPVPPPRKKRISRQLASALPSPLESAELSAETVAHEKPSPGPPREGQSPACHAETQSPQAQAGAQPQSTTEFKGSLASLSDSVGVPTSATDQDSYSTSSTEEELEQFSSPSVKKKPSMILGKARHRLSLVSFTSVFQAFLSNDRKLYKKVVELAQDKSSYFGNLVQDYKVYSLEMMARQASSTEMLQEIRTMMTQLKSYLLQSTELKALVDPTLHSEEELEAIVESALYKCVLKPLKEAIDSCLREIHSKDGSLQQLKENQLVILATTTTDLGVTTSVPEVPVMEKILQKFTSMHKAYSPEKKIAILLKTCKLIYDSMALGNPGRRAGRGAWAGGTLQAAMLCGSVSLPLPRPPEPLEGTREAFTDSEACWAELSMVGTQFLSTLQSHLGTRRRAMVSWRQAGKPAHTVPLCEFRKGAVLAS